MRLREAAARAWGGWRKWRWLEAPLVAGIAGTLAYDRYLLCQQYLFKYTDEDQALMWYAAHELLQGRIHEPCFYGQDYNSCLEGWLAAPLVGLDVPYHVAVPLVSVILGLLPFLVLAWVAWRRGQSVVAAACLLAPLLMPVRYGIMTGMPRGFVTGLALAMVPTALLLPPRGRQRTWPALRYFVAGALALLAVQINPNCMVLLVPVLLYAVLTTWRQWRFWFFGLAGVAAAAPYLMYAHQFYHVAHPDYVSYLRGVTYGWSYADFNMFFRQYVWPRNGMAPSRILSDLVPLPVTGAQAGLFMAAAFAAVGGLLVLRGRVAGVIAGVAGVVFTFVTFGYQRVVTIGDNAVAFPYARMYIALPVLLLWLLLLVNHKPWARLANAPAARWVARGALTGLVIAAIVGFNQKQRAMPGIIAQELRDARICPQVPVEQVYATAREVQRLADRYKADLLIVGGAEKHWAYLMPELTTVETIYASPMLFERRTWRLIEESTAKHNNVLLINLGGARVGGGPMTVDREGNPVDPRIASTVAAAPNTVTRGRGPAAAGGRGGAGGRGRGATAVVAGAGGTTRVEVPIITMVSAGGKSIWTLGVVLPRIFTPAPTKDNPHPTPQAERIPWRLR